MTAPALPSAIHYGTVRWTVLGIAEDANDANTLPESEKINGTVTFTPQFTLMAFYGDVSDTVPKTILPRPEVYDIVNGRLQDKQGHTDISLVANDTPSTSPVDWNYRVDFEMDGGYSFGSFFFKLTNNQVVDLTTVAPQVDPDTGILYVAGPIGPGFTFRGAWATGQNYAVRDVVTNGGSTFVVTTAVPVSSGTGPTPTTPGASYALWSSKGDPGPGVAAAGATGSVLQKTSAADYDTSWITTASGPTVSSIMKRDSAGRAQVADPSLNADIVTLQFMRTDSTRKRSVVPGSPGSNNRQWMRVLTMDGQSATSGAYAVFLLTGAGDYGDVDRGTYQVQMGQRGDNIIQVKIWSWNHDQILDPIEFYTKQISTYVFELWVKLSDFNQTHYLHELGSNNVTTWNLDSLSITAPTGISAQYPITELNTVAAQAAAAIPTSQRGAVNGVATLDAAGKLTATQVPAIAINDFLGAVASQAAMLALTGQRGDWATRTDLSADWILIGDDPTLLANWRQISAGPGGGVTSVAGRSGAVTLTSADLTDVKTSLGMRWKPSTAYTAGDVVMNPSGQWVSAIATFTSGTTYSAANWTPTLPSELVPFTGTGIVATNVRDAILEVLGYSDDAGDIWSASTKTLNVNAGTYVTDSDLNVPIAANQAMWLDYYLSFSGPTSATANLRAQLVGPTGCTAEWSSALDYDAAGSAGTPKGQLGSISTVKTFSLGSAITGVHIRAKIVNGATAGTISIQFSPDTTTASALVRSIWSKVAYSRAQ